jgi:hypothetical protein
LLAHPQQHKYMRRLEKCMTKQKALPKKSVWLDWRP